ncbi:extracellular solute-binding protein [Paenibacillus flagellatus]|uniref:ABC transporter substrate-binding protein n=1 Tax=Paenibacillus flagellatus TaxID=2211139 RepID=A0A2V5KFS3_9BACL|nr:extracellular solute-binding protein [Paenibacillus flagellatus]PYI57384.1 ABC transporter substrate-binding protein [Paenibacillus flagellatus]
MLKKRNEFEGRYALFRNEIRGEILSGAIRPGEFLLSEVTLGERYNLSRTSVRRVLAELEADGLIEKMPGKGNRVRQPERKYEKRPLKVACFSESYEIPILHKTIRLFEQAYPHVKVELAVLPTANYVASVLHSFEGEQAPDVVLVSEFHLRQIGQAGKLDALLSSAPDEWDGAEDVYPGVLRMFTEGARLKAVPLVFSPVVYCYNTELIPDPASVRLDDWDDLLALAQRYTLADEQGNKQQYGFGFSISGNRWSSFLLQNGGAFYEEDGSTPSFAGERTEEAFQFCLDLMYKHQVSPISIHGSTRLVEDLFIRNKVAVVLSTYYFMSEFRHNGMNWDVLPVVPGNRTKGTTLIGGGLAIRSGTDQEKLARTFAEFMLGREAQAVIKREGCTLPARASVAEDESLWNPDVHPKHYGAFRDVVPHARSLNELGVAQDKIDMLQRELVLLWSNLESPGEACRRIEPLLAREEPGVRGAK